jgi:hypothetical protein
MCLSYRIPVAALVAAVLLPAAAVANVVTVTESGLAVAVDVDPLRARTDIVRAGTGAGGIGSWSYLAGGSAVLARGTLGVYVIHDTVGLDSGEAPPVRAMAQLFDMVTFHGAGPTTDVTLSWNVLGSFNALNDASALSTRAQIGLNGQVSAMTLAWWPPDRVAIHAEPFSHVFPTIDIHSALPNAVHATMRADYMVPTGVALPLSGLLFTEVGPHGSEHAIANFAHTATLAIGLPAGVTFSSGSGVLLAVPEAPAAALVLAGLLVVSAAAARRRVSAPRSGTAHRACRVPARR